MPRQVGLASGFAFALHGLFILTARYRLSYDAYTHMFLGDHYRMDWWSLWETRWYTGFEVTSYPPLAHQIIGLLSHVIGVEAAFALLLWIVLSAYPVAIYAFSRIFAGKTAAGYAAIGAAFLPSIYLAANTFGQLPTLMGTLFALFAMAELNEFLHTGSKISAALAVALIGTVMAAHHATSLFLPFAVAAVVIHQFFNHPTMRLKVFQRLAVFVLGAVGVGFLVIWPFWLWGMHQSIQTTIDHLSRHNFFLDPQAPALFFFPVYGPLVAFIPLVFWKSRWMRLFGLRAAFLALFVIGLGGTTPIPHLLFGSGWEWLTYDRFAFWASLLLLVLFGIAMAFLRQRWPGFARSHLIPISYILLEMTSIVAGLIPTLLPTQPNPVDLKPIVNFLAEGERAKWRYVTFGFGDQYAAISLQTTATTIDGSYHTARLLPELRISGVGQIDASLWVPDGLTKLLPILQKASERGVRWGFVNRKEYIPDLRQSGWIKLTTLSNGIQVWENPLAVIPPPVVPPAENLLAEFSWGVFPLLSLAIAGALAAVRLNPGVAKKILLAIHFMAIGLLPIALCFWYFRSLANIEHAKVYFTYDQAIFYASDALALVAILSWAIIRFFTPTSRGDTRPHFRFFLRVEFWLGCLCLLSSLSILWSVDWRVSLSASLQLWLVFGLFYSLLDLPGSWRAFAAGGCAALFLQVVLGVWQVGVQSTAMMAPLGLNWPGVLNGTTAGASVVQLLDGTRWLRAYGSLPHPNILGGFAFVFLAFTIAIYLLSAKPHPLLVVLSSLGVILLLLTFSRSAWLAFAAFALVLGLQFPRFERKRLVILLVACMGGLLLVLIPGWHLMLGRVGNSSSQTEAFSILGRTWLTQESWLFIRERPFTGLGMSAFILELAFRAGYGYIIEPVHNIPLLITSELGLFGSILLGGLTFTVARGAVSAGRKETVIFAAVLVGLGVIAMVDHYLWTLAPCRMFVGLILGVFAGNMRHDGTV